MTQRSAQHAEAVAATLSISASTIVVACKRNAVVRNIAFGSDDGADHQQLSLP
jgi:hypothetical protein